MSRALLPVPHTHSYLELNEASAVFYIYFQRIQKSMLKKSLSLCRHWGSVQAVRPIGGVEVNSYSFMATALKGGEGTASRPGRFLPPWKIRYALYRRLGGPRGRSGQVRKISPPPGFDPLNRPARSQSLYRLRYPANLMTFCAMLSVGLSFFSMESK
jgi:hypothetical protein